MMTRMEIDRRESQSEVLTHLRRMEELSIEVCRLGMGTYRVADTIIADRILLLTFAQSTRQDISRQLGRLCSSEWIPVLLVEGGMDGTSKGGNIRQTLRDATISANMTFGIPLLRTQTSEETARLLLYLARHLDRQSLHRVPARGGRPHAVIQRQLYILQELLGAGLPSSRAFHSFKP